MLSLKISKLQTCQSEVYIYLKNAKCELIFACSNASLLNFFQAHMAKDAIISLSYFFGHEIVRYFGSQCENELFEVSKIVLSQPNLDGLQNFCVDLFTDSDEDTPFLGMFYASKKYCTLIQNYISSKNLDNLVPKVTGLPEYSKIISIEKEYKIKLRENIRLLRERTTLLNCVYEIEGHAIEFYFPKEIVNYFCKNFIQLIHEEILSPHCGKIFFEIFGAFLAKNFNLFVKNISSNLVHFKYKNLLEFSMKSAENDFTLYCDSSAKLYLLKLMMSLEFKIEEKSAQKIHLNQAKLSFPVEVGVTYLNFSEFKNLSEGDIIIFDKTCLSKNENAVEQCVINLNGINLISDLKGDSCHVTHITKDW